MDKKKSANKTGTSREQDRIDPKLYREESTEGSFPNRNYHR